MRFRRIVLKVGSHILSEKGAVAKKRMLALVQFIASIKELDYEVILVSSGAVSAGYTKFKLDKSEVSNKQVLAGIGQPYLMKMYQEKFDIFDILCSQVLLYSDIFSHSKHINHAKNAIDIMLKNCIVPIVNENDTVSIDELVFGDNDRLSAYIAHHFDADLLIILSDIDALYDKDPNKHSDAKRRAFVDSISKEELEEEYTPNNEFATGGIVTKLQSADFLLKNNREMFLASGFDLTVVKSLLLEDKFIGGTFFSKKNV